MKQQQWPTASAPQVANFNAFKIESLVIHDVALYQVAMPRKP